MQNCSNVLEFVLQVTTDVNPTDPEQAQRGVPWWLYLLAILIGLIILALLILCLWRVSASAFFSYLAYQPDVRLVGQIFGELLIRLTKKRPREFSSF